MSELTPWIFLTVILTPAVHAELLPRVRGEARARALAIAGAVGTLLGASALTALVYVLSPERLLVAQLPLGTTGHACHFALDSLSGPLLPTFSLLTLALVLGSPRGILTVSRLRALFWLEALTLTALATDDLVILAIAWGLTLWPLDQLTTHAASPSGGAELSRIFRVYHGVGALCFLGACLALGVWSSGDAVLGVRLLGIDGSGVPRALQSVIFCAFVVAAMQRMGVAPFHSWLPLAVERGASAAPAVLVAMRTSIYVLLRLAIPAFPEAAHAGRPLLTAVALCGAVYGAFGALGQTDLRRMIGFFIVSQSGLMLTGVTLGEPSALSGALLYWLGFAAATTGLVLMVSALAARTGGADVRGLGGIVRKVPGLAGCFFLFGLASIAIPGSPAFVAEDLLVHGALAQHPLLTVVVIATTVVNAITFVRAFNQAFLGDLTARSGALGTLQDLLPRERIAAVSLLLVLVGVGLYPGPIVDAQNAATRATVAAPSRGTHHVEAVSVAHNR